MCNDCNQQPCGCDDGCHQVTSAELKELQTIRGKDENGCPAYEVASDFICRQLSEKEQGLDAVPGVTNVIDPDTCKKRKLPAFPTAAQVTTDDTLTVVNTGTAESPIWSLVVNICNALAKITGGAVRLPYGSTTRLIGNDCNPYLLPNAPVINSPDTTVQVTESGTGISPIYSLAVNACAVLAKITGTPVKLPFGGGVLVGQNCQLYSLPDLPVLSSSDLSVTITPGGTPTSPTFNFVVNLCKALLGVTDSGNTAEFGTDKVLTKNPDGTCEIKNLPTPAAVVPCAVIQGIATSATPVQSGDLIPVKKVDGTCEARPMPSYDCTLENNAGVIGINGAALISGSTFTPGVARGTFSNPSPHAINGVISNVVSATISNPSTCRTGKVKIDVDWGYWGYQIETVQDVTMAARFEINVNGAGWVAASNMLGDEGKDIFSDPSNKSDMGQDGTSISFIATVPISGSITVQARIIALTVGNVSYSENPVISWFGLAI